MTLERRRIGRTKLTVTTVGFGGTPLGNFIHAISERECENMLDRAWDSGIRLFDTSPAYGNGLSEWRYGHTLRKRPRDQFVLSTKVGRLLKPTRGEVNAGRFVDVPPFATILDYGYDATMRSIDDSLQRMGTSHIDIALIHDVDRRNNPGTYDDVFRAAMDGAFRALADLRSSGSVGAIGIGVNETEPCLAALRHGDFDCFLLAGRYTLLEQEPLDELLPLCLKRGVSLLLGGVYNGGILATGPREGAKYDYRPAPPAVAERASRIAAICERYATPLPAAALQFPLAHPAVAAVLIGTRNVDQLSGSLALMNHAIPAELWAGLKREGLLRDDAPVPGASVVERTMAS